MGDAEHTPRRQIEPLAHDDPRSLCGNQEDRVLPATAELYRGAECLGQREGVVPSERPLAERREPRPYLGDGVLKRPRGSAR
jgi:hypothetical protein